MLHICICLLYLCWKVAGGSVSAMWIRYSISCPKFKSGWGTLCPTTTHRPIMEELRAR